MLSLFHLFVQPAHAASPPGLGPVGGIGSVSTGSSQTIISTLYSEVFLILTIIAGVLAVLYLVWYGIQYITSGGNPEKAKVARSGIINAIIGIVIVIAAYAIIRVAITIGRQLTNATGPTATTQTGTDSATDTGSNGSSTGSDATGSATPETITITFKTIDAAASTNSTDVIVPLAAIHINTNTLATSSSTGTTTFTGKSATAYTIKAEGARAGVSLACQGTISFSGSGTVVIALPPATPNLTPCIFEFTKSSTPSSGSGSGTGSGTGGSTAIQLKSIDFKAVDARSGAATPFTTIVINNEARITTDENGKASYLVTTTSSYLINAVTTAPDGQRLNCQSSTRFTSAGTLSISIPAFQQTPPACSFQFTASTTSSNPQVTL